MQSKTRDNLGAYFILLSSDKHARILQIPNSYNQSANACQLLFYLRRELDELTFHAISDETLHVLMEYFEQLGDLGYFEKDYDIEYSVSFFHLLII